MTKNEMLNQKVCDKMQAELDEFIAELKQNRHQRLLNVPMNSYTKRTFYRALILIFGVITH